MATPAPIPSENDWNISSDPKAPDWKMNQNEPLGATEKRVRFSVPKETVVQIGFPERVPGVGPSYTAPFVINDVFPAMPGAPNSEPQLRFPINQRGLEWWLFTPEPTPPPVP